MTWLQFKAKVDEQMREKGIAEDVEIENIDTVAIGTLRIALKNGRMVIE